MDHCCEAHRRHSDAPCPRWHWDAVDQRPELTRPEDASSTGDTSGA